MSIAQAYLAEFEQEAQITRRFLERLPDPQLAWKPHAKSMSAGQLALHLALVPGQVMQMAPAESVPLPDFSAPNPQPDSVKDVLAAFDQSVAKVREILPQIDDAAMMGTWRAVRDGRDLFAMPRAALIRMLLLSHWIQHRGQLSVYLRLLGQNVPSSYGPSADERPDFMKSA